MKISLWISAVALMASASTMAAVPDSCKRVKEKIQQKIIKNGVPESDFTLSIVPNDQADQERSQVVGHCANDTHKILYIRHNVEQTALRSNVHRSR